MSAILVFAPVIPEKYQTLCDELRFLFKEKFELDQGSIVFDRDDVRYLEGLKDGFGDRLSQFGSRNISRQIQAMIDAIIKHDRIKVWLQS